MLPSSNRISGMCFAFPDVCLTPMIVPVPIPYPNTGLNVAAATFALRVLLCAGNAFNQTSIIALTLGDEAGVLHPTHNGPATFLVGYPKVIIEGTPAIPFLAPTMQNLMNSVGAQIVPSITNIFYGYARELTGIPTVAETVAELDKAMVSSADSLHDDMVAEGIGRLVVEKFTPDLPARAYAAIERLRAQGARELILDLRGNPGGDVHAAMDFVREFLPAGAIIATLIDAEGDETVYRSFNADPCDWPLTVLVDRSTASAAEIVAGALRAHGRAVLLGETTYGKGTVQTFVGGVEGPTYVSVARVVLADGVEIQGRGIDVDDVDDVDGTSQK